LEGSSNRGGRFGGATALLPPDVLFEPTQRATTTHTTSVGDLLTTTAATMQQQLHAVMDTPKYPSAAVSGVGRHSMDAAIHIDSNDSATKGVFHQIERMQLNV
jgi:hypothetical protein